MILQIVDYGSIRCGEKHPRTAFWCNRKALHVGAHAAIYGLTAESIWKIWD